MKLTSSKLEGLWPDKLCQRKKRKTSGRSIDRLTILTRYWLVTCWRKHTIQNTEKVGSIPSHYPPYPPTPKYSSSWFGQNRAQSLSFVLFCFFCFPFKRLQKVDVQRNSQMGFSEVIKLANCVRSLDLHFLCFTSILGLVFKYICFLFVEGIAHN